DGFVRQLARDDCRLGHLAVRGFDVALARELRTNDLDVDVRAGAVLDRGADVLAETGEALRVGLYLGRYGELDALDGEVVGDRLAARRRTLRALAARPLAIGYRLIAAVLERLHRFRD